MNYCENRESYLVKAVSLMTGLFISKGYVVPNLRVSCGWPNSGGTRAKKRVLGQAWSTESASDGVIQIFISPYLSDPVAEYGVLAVLLHELCHAVVGNEEKHNKVFGKCARAVGLTGKMTSPVPSEELQPTIEGWAKSLGTYPNGSLDLTKSPTKKQGTRMVKCECAECGYVVRTAKKWLDFSGAPICPCNEQSMTFESPADPDAEDKGGEDDSDE